MDSLSTEVIISLALTALSLIITFISHYFYVRGKLHKAASGAIADAEQDGKTGEEKLEIAVDQVYGLIPTMLKPLLHRSTVRKIVQAAFDHIEIYAQKQVEKKSKKKEDVDCLDENNNSANEANESGSGANENSSEVIVSEQDDDYTDSGGTDTEREWNELNDIIQQNKPAPECAATEDNDQTPDVQSATQSRACSINTNSIREKIIMENNNINNTFDNVNNNAINDEPVTCYEDIGAGTEYSKQFTNPKTGLHTAVLFSSPIDNNDGIATASEADDFIDAVNDDGEEVFESRRNKFLVRLAKSTAQNKLVELIQDDYRIAMSPVAAVTSKLNRFVGTIRRDIQAMRNLRRDPKAAKNKITELVHGAVKFALKDREPSDVRFANIINNCDLEYLVENNRLKENIIVNAKSEAYEYLFNLNLGKLEARMSGKQIELYDAETNEVKFLIPAPYMYDMANEKSDAVEYMLEGSAGNYTLRVIADETWINADARQFPVVIDPQIMGNTETIISFKGGTRTGNFTTPTGDCIAIGNNRYNNADHEYTAQIILHGNAIRQHIGKELKVTHAILELTKTGEDRASGSTGFNVRKDSITGTIIDRFVYNGINNRIEIDITEQIQEIIDGTTDKSLFIDRVNTNSVTDYLLIATALVANAEYKPRIFVDYVSARINTDDMPFASASAGKGGSGKVNLVTGNLLWEVPEVQIKSRGVELGISHVYDGYLAGKDQDYINSANSTLPKTPKLCCGKGFKLNIQQYLLEKKYNSAVTLMGTRNYVYIDGSGNHHDFVEKFYYTDDNKCKRFVERINCVEDEDGNLKYVVDGKSYEVKHEIDNELGLTLESYKDLLSYVLEGKAYTVAYYRIENGRKVRVSADRAGESGVYAERDYGDGIKVGISDKLDIKEVEEAKAAVDECELKIEEVKSQIQSGHYSGEAYALLQRKQKRYESELADKTTKLNKAISDKKRNPVDFITDGNGQTLGFDYYGRLVLVGNGSESGSAFIIYNTDDRIERVVDKDGISLVALGYKDDLLEYITDKNGKTYRYAYDGSKRLTSISYGDETLCEFGYNSYHLNFVGKKIGGRVLTGAKINSGIKLTKLQEYSEISKISETESIPGTAIYAKELTITYTDRYMAKLTDEKTDIATTYIMDNMGRIVTAYEGEGVNAKSVSVEYRERKRAFSSNDLFTDNKILAENASVSGVSSKRVLTLTDTEALGKIPKSGMMLLSAWATAPSFNLIYNRRQTAYGDDIFGHYELDANNSADVQRSNRRFGLFAKVYYTDGTAPDEHYASFDYYNPHRQLGILPVFVQPRKVLKVSKIEYGVDYSYNNGTADFENLKLTTCKGGTYREFDDDDMLVKETTDEGTTVYDYVDDKPIKATFTRFRDDQSFVSLRDYDTMGRERFTRDFDGNCKATFYDDNGMVAKTEEYHESDTTTKRVKEYRYDNDGNVMGESDERGESGGQELYNINYIDDGVTTRTRNSGGAVTAMGYDRYTGENTGLSGDADGDPNTAQYTYKHGMMTKASHNGFDIDYTYDGLGRVKTLTIGGQRVISSCEYNDADHTSTVNGVGGIVVKTTTDAKGNTVSIEWDNIEKLHKDLDDKDRITVSEDKYANITYRNYYGTGENESDFSVYIQAGKVVKKEEFDDQANTTQIKKIQVSKLSFYKQADSTVVAATGEVAGNPEDTRITKVHYDKSGYEDIETEVELPSGINIYPELDDLGRYAGCVQQQQGYGSALLTENRYYVKHGDRTCDLIASERFGINGVIDEHIKYSYDAAGNITAIYINGEAVFGYGYDSLNRLVREEKYLEKRSIDYIYDNGGNLVKKIIKDSKMGRNVEEKTFVYNANGWRDRLTKIITKTISYKDDGSVNEESVKDEIITYDNYGRALNYRDKKFEFSKFLNKVKNKEDKVIGEYEYNVDGIRISKTAGGKTTKFFYDSTKLVRSIVDTKRDIWYNYGVNGIQGISVKESGASTVTEYVFRRNAQGDVTHIYKLNSGALELIARYKYDAWGKHTVYKADGKTEDTNENSIGNINPIRYRGYYYDTETGLYYLKTRYYDPEIGRFISADDTNYLDPQTINGLNLFVYCGNNPVMNVDENGNSWKSFWKGVGNWFKKNWAKVVTVVVAVVAVALVATGVGIAIASSFAAVKAALGATLAVVKVVGTIATSIGMTTLSYMYNSIQEQGGFDKADYTKVLGAAGKGAAVGLVSGILSVAGGSIIKDYGSKFGYLLSKTPHIGSGLIIGKVFSSGFLAGVGGFLGYQLGSKVMSNLIKYIFGGKS